MADTLHDDSMAIRQPQTPFERAENYQRENGTAMFWKVFIEQNGHAEPAGTAYELSSGEIILPPIAANGRVLLKHDFRRA